jgi:ABC-type uncharacterized transport system permease subunit
MAEGIQMELFLLNSTIAKTMPLLLAALGGLVSERSGVINFALEGMMLMGAFFAVFGSYYTGDPFLGVMAAIAAGGAMGLLHAFGTLIMGVNQLVSSIALNLLALGATGFLLNQIFGVYGTSPSAPSVGSVRIGPLSVSPFVLFAGVLLIVLWIFLYRTRAGLRLRAAGEGGNEAFALGVNVKKIRFCAVVASGCIAAVGGAYISLGEMSLFIENMTNGRGYLAIAVLICGRWRPFPVMWFALLFGFATAISEYAQVSFSDIPLQVTLMLPFVLTLLVLAGFFGGAKPPAGLGKQ